MEVLDPTITRDDHPLCLNDSSDKGTCNKITFGGSLLYMPLDYFPLFVYNLTSHASCNLLEDRAIFLKQLKTLIMKLANIGYQLLL